MGKKLSLEQSVNKAAKLKMLTMISALRKLQAAGELTNDWETIIGLVARESFTEGASFIMRHVSATMTEKDVLKLIAKGGNAFTMKPVNLSK